MTTSRRPAIIEGVMPVDGITVLYGPPEVGRDALGRVETSTVIVPRHHDA